MNQAKKPGRTPPNCLNESKRLKARKQHRGDAALCLAEMIFAEILFTACIVEKQNRSPRFILEDAQRRSASIASGILLKA